MSLFTFNSIEEIMKIEIDKFKITKDFLYSELRKNNNNILIEILTLSKKYSYSYDFKDNELLLVSRKEDEIKYILNKINKK